MLQDRLLTLVFR